MAHAALDTLNAQVAILDETGAILMVNQAWRDFARDNGAAADTLMEGVNYLHVCDGARGDGAQVASTFAEGIRAVIRGERELFVSPYPCHSPWEQRLFLGRAA